MHKHLFTLPLLFLSFIITINTHTMERECDVLARQAEEYNKSHPFMQFPLETHQNIISIGYVDDEDVKMNNKNFDELKTVVGIFFKLNRVCRYFNQSIADKKLILPWLYLSHAKKNEMMENTLSYVIYKLPQEQKNATVLLSFVYSGVDPNMRSANGAVPLLRRILQVIPHEPAIKMLLKHGADPSLTIYKTYSAPICFGASTPAIGKLLVEKINKTDFLKKFGSKPWYLLHSSCSLEMMKFWLDYGIDPKSVDDRSCSLFHWIVEERSEPDILAKAEVLLAYIPDMINHKNSWNCTPLDVAIAYYTADEDDDCEATEIIIEFLKAHGAKTRFELRAETIQ